MTSSITICIIYRLRSSYACGELRKAPSCRDVDKKECLLYLGFEFVFGLPGIKTLVSRV